MPHLVFHPDEVKVLSRLFGQGAVNIPQYGVCGKVAPGRTEVTEMVTLQALQETSAEEALEESHSMAAH